MVGTPERQQLTTTDNNYTKFSANLSVFSVFAVFSVFWVFP
jgi:hypothetical protein